MEMTACKLTKLSDNENELRTKEVVGEFMTPPKIGSSFVMFAESIHPDGFARMIATSRIMEIDCGLAECTIHTENSTYKLELL